MSIFHKKKGRKGRANVISDLKPYTPEGFLESRHVKEGKVLSTSQALNLLKQRGYIIKGEPLAVS